VTFGEWCAQQGAWDWATHALVLAAVGLSIYYALRRRPARRDLAESQQRAIDALIETNDALIATDRDQQEAIDLALRAAENLSRRLRALEDDRA
jgi:hypothetical protein